MPSVGGAVSPSTHVQEMPFLSQGGFSPEKDKLLVHTILGQDHFSILARRDLGGQHPGLYLRIKLLSLIPVNSTSKTISAEPIFLSLFLLYIACADGPTGKIMVSVGVGSALLLLWLPGSPQRVRSLFSSLV